MTPIKDEWNGLADLLANLIEKYAADLSIDELPASKPAICAEHGSEKEISLEIDVANSKAA